MATVWTQADKLGSLLGLPPIERPERITRRASPLLRGWPPCHLCGCDVNRCECDPDEAQGAALAAMLNRPSKGEA